jgi:hypothetical protein
MNMFIRAIVKESTDELHEHCWGGEEEVQQRDKRGGKEAKWLEVEGMIPS